jgi:hypothetical protein
MSMQGYGENACKHNIKSFGLFHRLKGDEKID